MMLRFLPVTISLIVCIGVFALHKMLGLEYVLDISHTELAYRYPSAVMPAAFVFGIWFTIFTFWIGTGLLLATEHIKIKTKQNVLFSLAIVLAGCWIAAWAYNLLFVPLMILVILIATLLTLFLGSFVAFPLLRYSVELLLAWAIVLFCINISLLLQSMGFPYGFPGDVYYTIFSVGFVFMAVSELQCRYNTYVMSAVFLWTLIGIAVLHDTIEQRGMVVIYTVFMAYFIWNSYHQKRTCLRTLFAKWW